MKINSTKWSMIRRTVNQISRELGNIDINDMDSGFGKNITFGINWPAMGTKSVEETKDFIDRMQKATEIANFLNKFSFEIDWTKEFEIKEGTKDYWLNEMKTLKAAIENQNSQLVQEFIDIEVN